MQFAEMMEHLMDGSITQIEIPAGEERAGIISPAMLVHAGRFPKEPFHSALLEATVRVMEAVEEYVVDELASDQGLLLAAEDFLGRECPSGGMPLGVGDLIKVRLSWRMETADTQMTVLVWHTIMPAIQQVEGGSAVLWPNNLASTSTHFWPPRILNNALRDALFSAGLHTLLSHTKH